MIRREMITVAFRTETKTSAKAEKIGYEKPELSKIGTAQHLLQGGWVSGDFDGYMNSFSRTYDGN